MWRKMRSNKKKKETNPLRKLSRTELLELLLEQTRKKDQLELENEALKEKIEQQRAAIAEAKSIAQSTQKLNDIIEKAEKARGRYFGRR